MANNSSQKKRNRQNEKRREHNAKIKSSIRTTQKKILKLIKSPSGEGIEESEKIYNDFVSKIDKAAKKSVFHRKNAARKKARLAKKINQLKQKATG